MSENETKSAWKDAIETMLRPLEYYVTAVEQLAERHHNAAAEILTASEQLRIAEE
jgi:hypothetical protein